MFFFYKKELGISEKKEIDTIKVGSSLDVAIEIERECRFGDFDIMLADLNMSGPMGNDLLLSVEPIVPTKSEFKPVYVKLSVPDIEFGYKKTFALSLPKQREHLGVFLCRDRDKKGKCNSKEIFDYGQIEESLQNEGSLKIRKADKIYFFQYLYAENDELHFLTDNVESLKEAFAAVDRITSTVANASLREEIKKKAKKLFDALGSYVVTKKPEKNKLTLQVMLAKMDKTKCSDLKPSAPEKVRIHRGKSVPNVFKDMGFDRP